MREDELNGCSLKYTTISKNAYVSAQINQPHYQKTLGLKHPSFDISTRPFLDHPPSTASSVLVSSPFDDRSGSSQIREATTATETAA